MATTPFPTNQADSGFTLIELMIVVVIIGILAAIAIPKFSNVSKSAKEAEAAPILKQISTLQARYYQKYDSYATSISSLEGGTDLSNAGKYYTYTVTGEGTTYCAAANPNAAGQAAGLSSRSDDGERVYYESNNCT